MKPVTYRPRSETVQAMRLTDRNADDVRAFAGVSAYRNFASIILPDEFGMSTAAPGDWIVKPESGAPFVMDHIQFQQAFVPDYNQGAPA